MKKTAALLLGLVMFLLSGHAQIFKYLGTEEGLSSRRVLAVRQTGQDYIWILTHKGIDRYDGRQFVHYKLRDNERTVNFYPNLNTLETDSHNALWEIGKDGLAFRLDRTKDEFRLMFNLHDSFPDIPQAPVTATFIDRTDNIWFCMDSQQFVYSSSTDQSYRIFPSLPGKIIGFAQSEDSLLYIATEHRLYTARLKERRLCQVQQVYLENINLINYIYYHSPSHQLIINTLLDKLYIYNPQSRQLYSAGHALKDIGINAIIPDRENPDELLIATDGDGVYRLNVTNRQLTPFLQEDDRHPNKMNGSIIKDICMDHAGRIWTAIYPTGITVHNRQYPNYEWIRHSPNYANSLANNGINGIMEDSEGDIWYATNDGISCYNTREGKWTNYLSSKPDGTSNNHIFISLCEIRPGKILAGGYMSGIYVIDKGSGSCSFYLQQGDAEEKTPDKYIRSIYREPDGTIWAGSFYSLKGYDTKTKEKSIYSISYPINQITRRDSASLWIGTIHGVYIFDKGAEKLQAYRPDMDFGCINTIYIHPESGDTYLGTYGNGLFRIDCRSGNITHYRAENSGLQTDNIYSILADRTGNLILGSEYGLSMFNPSDTTFTYWSKTQGLLPSDFNPNAAVRTSHHNLIFGSNEGAVILPDSICFPDSFTTRMVFSNLNIMYRSVSPGEKGSPLTLPLDETSVIELDYDQNTFSMEVSSINFDAPLNILYSWKLEGFYDVWTPPSEIALIRYTNLSPGNYILKVRAISRPNNRILEERSIQIRIGRPFWLTFWAFLFYAAIIMGATYAWFRYQVIKRERQISKEKINFFTNAAHDIRTPLTLIKAPLSEIQKSEQLSEEGMHNINLAIQNTETLSELAENMLNFQKEEVYSSQAIVSDYELNDYLEGYLHSFKEYAHQIGISLSYQSRFDRLKVWIDRQKMDSILRNLLSNALKYTSEGGSVTVEVWHNKTLWFLCITDTGIGIPKNDQKRMFRYLFRGNNATNQLISGSGIGMLLTYRQIKNHEGKISFSSTENVGTRFLLSFPIHSRNYQYKTDRRMEKIADAVMPTEQQMPVSQNELQSNNTLHPDAPLILTVEDNVALRSFIMQSLSPIYRVAGAENGQKALELVKEEQPDLILSDIMMPIMDGKELCKRIKENMETSHIPVILLTALGDKEQILEGLGTKADQYIVKPFDLNVLKANISTVLENRNLIRQRYRQAIDTLSDLPTDGTSGFPSSLDEEFMQRVTVLTKERLGKELTVDILCAAVNMSRTSFYNKIKALTGISPNDFIRNIRMKEAADLLKSRRYTVAEVADRIGFADPKYFTDAFKKFYGVPPSVYIKQQQKNHTDS